MTLPSSLAFEIPTLQVVNLEILVNNEDFVGTYDLLEVWRSRDTASGTYEELTAESWTSARLPSTGGDPPSITVLGPNVNVVDKDLELIIKSPDLVLLTLTFAGTDPLSLAQVAGQIAAQSGGRLRSYVDDNALLVIETVAPGTGALLRILPSDAASILALPMQLPDALAFGRTPCIQLVRNQNLYIFSDESGAPTYFYKTRFRNRGTGATSDFSLPFGANLPVGVSPTNLVTGFLDLVTNDGRPLSDVDVSIRSPFVGGVIEGKLVAGADLNHRTDAGGHVEFTLIRGQKYSLVVGGTNLALDFTAPTDQAVSSFLMVDPSVVQNNDYFRVRVPELPVLERRNL